MSMWPFLRTPFTDLTGGLVNHQNHGKCATMEMKVIDCMEAYGVDKGAKKCECLIKDFQECVGMQKQLKRFYTMRLERMRQIRNGERSKENQFAEAPKMDSY